VGQESFPQIEGPGWTVRDLGAGTHLFYWTKGFYLSPFLVTTAGVVAVDPVNQEVARVYREAIAAVTDQPIRTIVYSHDHRDHIVGASELAPGAEIVAHPLTRDRILARGDRDIALPTRLVDDGDELLFGEQRILIRYFGPSHSDSNLVLLLPTGDGRLAVVNDIIEPGIVPYRNLPDTDLRGLMHTLEELEKLDFAWLIGGHSGPGEKKWVGLYISYLTDLIAATSEAYRAGGGQAALPGEDGIAMTERVRLEACDAAAARLRGKYGEWRGFEAWAPQTADRVLSYLITGN